MRVLSYTCFLWNKPPVKTHISFSFSSASAKSSVSLSQSYIKSSRCRSTEKYSICIRDIQNTHADTHTHVHIIHLTKLLIFWHFRLIIWNFWILKSWPTYWKLIFMFAQVFVARWYGISRCFHGDKGNVSGSPEFRPGKVLTDKQNEKVSSLSSAIPSLFSPHTSLLSPISSSVCFPPLPPPTPSSHLSSFAPA